MDLRERWIQAMSKVPLSLVGYEGYTQQDADVVCQCFRENPPRHLNSEKVLALENETQDLFPAPIITQTMTKRPFTKNDFVNVLKAATRPVSTIPISSKPKPVIKTEQPNLDDYPAPWCRVTKDGKLVRYEDANGKPIPDVLWSN